ncbi:hypothetical protein [Xenorhabdus bovienii]|uniref:hypothetical protein n=1 Tax=Xenorhabdus bovienii TaxID=40576 RepID=UPI0023B2B22C|nr:hypothetical protein [Xenorhabdus bovienii]MDE9543637.1 hypothetical protein [Xenorhabdus bovienii]
MMIKEFSSTNNLPVPTISVDSRASVIIGQEFYLDTHFKSDSDLAPGFSPKNVEYVPRKMNKKIYTIQVKPDNSYTMVPEKKYI